jgi:hypothetical protein
MVVRHLGKFVKRTVERNLSWQKLVKRKTDKRKKMKNSEISKVSKVIAIIAATKEGITVDSMVVENVTIFDPESNAEIQSDVFVVNDPNGFPMVIGVDSKKQLYKVCVTNNGDKADTLVLDNNLDNISNCYSYGFINYSDKTVRGWNFDNEPLCTTPEGFTSSGYFIIEKRQ